MKHTPGIQTSLLVITILAAFGSCKYDSIQLPKGNYFPLENNTEWVYQRKLGYNEADSSIWSMDTLSNKVGGDTLVGGKMYKIILGADDNIEKVIRVDGNQYFGRRHELYGSFANEYMFLDTDKPVGSSWIYFKDDSTRQTEYIIKAKNSKHIISGKVFEYVIELEVNYYYKELDRFKYWLTTKHYYAKDVGEIYTFYPYPVSGFYSNSSLFLIANK